MLDLSKFYGTDKIAFGIVPGEQLVNVKDLKVKYKIDYENAVEALKKNDYFKDDFDSLPPIEVKYEKGKLNIEDGYHRYVYAKKHNIDKIKADVSIRDNPYGKLGIDLDNLIKRFKMLKK